MPSYVIVSEKPPKLEGQPTRYRLDPTRRETAQERRRLERELTDAARAGQFVLHYQPRVALATGAPCAAEALIRWPSRKRGMIVPSAFIPLAEQGGQIIPIGGWVLRAACRAAQGWKIPWNVAVNVSARQLAAGVLLGQVAAALDESGLSPDRLELELTESLLIDIDTDTLLMLSALRDLGVGLALDDFGTGYAGLRMLKRLPLTTMKIDRSLVRDLPQEPEDAAIVRAVVATGHALGLTVVAEGVETEGQRAFLTDCGCDEGQGYLFGRPVPDEVLAAQMA